jgi:low affinity Fe/Cu permease
VTASSSNFIGITTVHVSGSLSAHHQEFQLYINIGTIYAVLLTAPSSNFIGITTIHVSGSLSAYHQEFQLYVSIGTIYAVLVT